MRLPSVLCPLVLLIAGCGGSVDHVPSPFFVVRRTSISDQDLMAGFDAEGEPMGVVYDDRTAMATVWTPKGLRNVSLIGHDVSFGLSLDAGFASFYANDGTILLLDVATGKTQAVDYGAVEAVDGGRTVVRDGTERTLLDLGRGTRTPLAVPADKSVWLLSGDTVLLIHDEGVIPGSDPGPSAFTQPSRAIKPMDDPGPVPHYYSFSLETTAGAPIADLVLPLGTVYAWVMAIDDAGEAVGFAYPDFRASTAALVRWDRSGRPTVLAEKANAGSQVSISDGGRVVVPGDGKATVYENGTVHQDRLVAFGSTTFTVSKDGRKAVLNDAFGTQARFYRLP